MTEYGINEDTSAMRVHVCPKARKLYVFPTESGRSAVTSKSQVNGFQPGIEYATARGTLVCPTSISSVRIVFMDTADALKYCEEWPTDRKGKWAEDLVADYLEAGRIPLPFSAKTCRDVRLQFAGKDMIASGSFTIQVKCDGPGGIGYGASGKLFLQTHELNPLNKH